MGSQCFETELDEALELLAQHPYLALVISLDYPIQEAETAFAMALDLIDPSKILVKIGALGHENGGGSLFAQAHPDLP